MLLQQRYDAIVIGSGVGGSQRATIRKVAQSEEEARRVSGALNDSLNWLEPTDALSFRDWLNQYTTNPRIHGLFQSTIATLLTVNSWELPASEYFKLVRNIAPLRFGYVEGGSLKPWERMAEIVRSRAESPSSGVILLGSTTTCVRRRSCGCTSQATSPCSTTRRSRCGTRRVNMVDAPSHDCPDVAPPGKHLYTVGAAPLDALAPGDIDAEFELVMDDWRDIIPGFDTRCRVLTRTCYRGKWPGFRTVPGSLMPHRTPVKGLFNVGDASCPRGFAGSMGAATAAMLVRDDLNKTA